MKKVKKGSSLICVVIMFALLVIAGTTLMMATFNGYKLRIRNNTRVKNLYGSESGLEKAYANVSNLIDESIVKGNEAVTEYNKEELAKKIEEEREKLDAFIKEKKQAKDKNKFIWDGQYVNEDSSLNQTNIYNGRNKAFKEGYKEKKGYKVWINQKIEDTIKAANATGKYVVSIVSEKESYQLTDKKEEVELDIESRFEDKGINRVLKTTFNIKTPEYNKPQNYKSVNIPVKTVWSKAFVAGGDLINRSNGEVEVDGDIYVYGKVGGKPSEGIVLEENSSFTLNNGKVVSLEDIRLKGSNTKFNVKSSDETEDSISKVFTGSLAIGDKFSVDKKADKKVVVGANIDINGKVYANNDLVLNGKGSNIMISKGFYGINDIKDETDKEGQSKNSSSMIVNADDLGNGSSITIQEEAILMGTAYINVDPTYQTGESIAIKGNYRAYGAPLKDGEYKEENIFFEYRDPLQLVTGFSDKYKKEKEAKGQKVDNFLYYEKEEYLNQYINQYNGANINKGKGITLPTKLNDKGEKIANVISIGGIFYDSVVKEGEFRKNNYTIECKEKIDKCKSSYESAKEQLKDIKEEIDFGVINQKTNEVDNSHKENGEDGKDTIYINGTGDSCTLLGENASEADAKGNIIRLGKKSKGIIISNGDVYIRGRIDEFKGTIITTKSITIEDNGGKVFIYDSNYLKNLIASKYELFRGVFIGNDVSNQVIRLDKEESGADKPVSSYVRQNLLKSKNWNIKK